MTQSKNNAAPIAIILTDHQTHDSFVENSYQRTAHCPVAGKTILEHILFELMAIKVTQTFIITHDDANKIHSMAQHGARWGMHMNTEVMQYNISKQEIIDTFISLSEPSGLLIIEANCLRSACMNNFIQQANSNDANFLEAVTENGSPIGLTYLKHKTANTETPWLMPISKEISVNHLLNAQQVIDANIGAIKGEFNGIQPAANTIQENQFQHYNAFVHKSCELEEAVMVGSHCHVGKNSALKNTVLNDHVYIEPGAQIDNSVIMPHTFIAKDAIIKNAIVNKRTIYQM